MSASPRLAVVNGLRGAAIVSVILYHLFGRFTEPGSATLPLFGLALPLSAPLENGWMGVNLFFILSGFVLFLPYARGEREITHGARDFYRRRFLRLMPLYYVNVAVCMALVEFDAKPAFASGAFWRDLGLMLTATFNFTEDLYYPPYNWVLWSLGLEIFFSLIFPLLVLLERRFGMRALAAGVLVLSLATRIAGERHYQGSFNPLLDPVKDSLLGRLDEFVLGMAACRLCVSGYRPRFPALGVLAGALALYVACALWDAVLLARLPRAAVPYLYLVTSLGATTLLLAALALGPGLLRALLANPPLQLAGMMCYSLYIWHGVLILHLFTAPSHYDPLPLAWNLAILLLASALSYRCIEFPHVRNTRALFRAA